MIAVLFLNNLVKLLTQISKMSYIYYFMNLFVFILIIFLKTRSSFLKTQTKHSNRKKKNQRKR